eukprot:6632481-Prymnesium_polylepis.1
MIGRGRTAAKRGGAFCDAHPCGPRAARTHCWTWSLDDGVHDGVVPHHVPHAPSGLSLQCYYRLRQKTRGVT